MTIYRVKHNRDNPYTRLNKSFLESPDLSAKAKGMLAYLLSRPDDWRICLSQLTQVFKDGESSIRSGLAELKSAGYLAKTAVRDQEGKIIGWVTDVYEVPLLTKKVPTHSVQRNPVVGNPDVGNPDVENPDVENPDVENPDVENRSQLNNDLLTNDFTNSPLTPHEEEEREESQNAIVSNWFASEQTSSDSLVSKKSSNEDNFSAAIVKKNEESPVKKCEEETVKKDEEKFKNPNEMISDASGSPFVMFQQPHEKSPNSSPSPNLRRYDSALGIRPPEEWKTLQQRRFNWVSEGPWLIDGKLDSNFVDWQATEWQKSYGGSIHKKRGDVLRHFKKDPANLVIAWEQYRSEHLHRYENAAVRMQNGLEIKPEEQQQLLAHSRAVSQPLPEEINPVASKVAVGSFIPLTASPVCRSEERVVVDIPAEVVDFPKASVSFKEVVETQQERDVCGGNGSLSSNKKASDLPKVDAATLTGRDVWDCNQGSWDERTQELGNSPETCSYQAPEQAENPAAYRQWQAKPIDDEPVSVEQFQALFASFSQRLSMRVKEGKHRQSEVSELDELNQWLADPILRREVMPRVMKSDRYTLDFDDYGSPLRVVEMKL